MDPQDPRIRPARAVSALLGQFFEMGARPVVREMTLCLVELCSGYDEEFRTGLEARFRNTDVLPPLDPSWEAVADRLQCVTGVTKFPQLRPRSELDTMSMDAYLALVREELPLGNGTHVATTQLLSVSAGIQHTADAQINFELTNCTSVMRVLIPIRECGHWMLAILIKDLEGNIEITISDSTVVLQAHPYTYASLFTWLAKMELHSVPSFSSHNPQQNMFGNDSGLFVLLGSRLAAISQTMPSEPEACSFMATFRRRVFVELSAKRLDPDSNHYEEFRQREGDVELGISLPTPPLTGFERATPTSIEDVTFGLEGFELASWPQNSPTYSCLDDNLIAACTVDIDHIEGLSDPRDLEEVSIYPSDLVGHHRDPPKSFEQTMQAHKTAIMQSMAQEIQNAHTQVPQLPTPEWSPASSDDGLFVSIASSDDGDGALESELLIDNGVQSQESEELNREDIITGKGTLIVQSLESDDWGNELLDSESENEPADEDNDSNYEVPTVRSLQGSHSDLGELSDDNSSTSEECGEVDGITEKVPWTMSPAELQGPDSAPFRYLAGIKTFYPPSDDLRHLTSILALSRPDAETTGAIKICLQHDCQPFALNIEHEVSTIEAYSREGHLFLDRSTSTGHLQDSLVSHTENDLSEESLQHLVSSFEKFNRKVDYFTDIDMCDEFRPKLNLPPSKIANLPDDMLSQTRESYTGIHTPLAAVSTTYGTPFSACQGNFELSAVNHLLYGAPAVWVIMSPASKLQVESLVCELAETEGDCSQFVRHQSVFLLTDKLRASGIKYSIILQKPGDVIFTFPGAYLQGFNMGMNLAEAINYAPEAVGDVEGYIPCREWCNPGVDPIPAQGMLPRSARKRLPVPGPADTGARKKQRLNQGRQFVSMEMLVSRLQEAVLFRRTAIANNGNNDNNMFNNTISTKDLWRMNQADSEGILRTVERRIFRDLLTERVNELKASGSSKEMIRDDLGASGSADSVCQYLRRAQIWTEVRKIFQEELPGKECWAIFCAIAPSTTALETMTNREKVKWLSAVEVDKQEVLALLELAIPSFMFALGYASHLPKQEFEDRIYDQSRDWETWFNE